MTAPAPSTHPGPVPAPTTAFEKKIAASPVYTEHVNVGAKIYDIKIVFARESTISISGAKVQVVFYKVFVADPSGVRVYSTTGSLWKTTKFLEYFRSHTAFASQKALLAATNEADRQATAAAAELYGSRVDS